MSNNNIEMNERTVNDIDIITQGVDSLSVLTHDVPSNVSKNKGIGAGGAKTTLNGRQFEALTSVEDKLIERNFTNSIDKRQKCKYLKSETDEYKIMYIKQHNFKKLLTIKTNILDSDIFRIPDEAFLIIKGETIIVVILEVKVQNVEGSVIEKITSQLKEDYDFILGDNIHLHFTYVMNNFLKDKFTSNDNKFQSRRMSFEKNDVNMLFYDETLNNDEEYYESLFGWLNSIMNEHDIDYTF